MNVFKAAWWAAFVSFVGKGFSIPPFEAVPWWFLLLVVWMLCIVALIKFFSVVRLEELYE